MRAADAAMYHAKAMGKNNCQFYSEELNQVVHQHLMLEASLSRAIGNHEMVLGYQPKVDLRTGKWSARKPWCAGTIRKTAWCRRINSSRWPRKPA
jgi:predicted signal transduction protein with EAL and GGDEF domain